MKIEITVPSKTFLFGEYLVLKGGPALLLNSTPRFKLLVEQTNCRNVKCINFGENNIIHEYIKTNPYLFDYLSLKFVDPYKGMGGFGATSALYLLVTTLKHYLEKSVFNQFTFLKDYVRFFRKENGRLACESDIISQLYGGITFYHKNVSTMKRIEWPFQHLTFCLIHADQKIATAEHLQQLPKIRFRKLEKYSYHGLNALLERDSTAFCKAMNRFNHHLQKNDLLSPHTNHLLAKILQYNYILAAKGCGALGADVICVLLQKKHKEEFVSWLNDQNLFLIGSDNFSTDGISIKNLSEMSSTDKVILVDRNDRQIGTEDKLIAHKKALLHRAFSIFIFRKQGKTLEFLLQQRADHKYHCANLWSNTCCSHPMPGEDTALAAKRRLQEEMGLSCPLNEVAVLHYIVNVGDGLKEHEIDHIFVGEYKDEKIKINPEEVKDFRWISLHDLIVDLKAHPKKYTPWLNIALRKLFSKRIFYKK